LKFNLPGIPPAVDHPLWQTWFTKAYAEDRLPYGVHTQLHHYVSSYDPLMSILASQTLWASDLRSLEDTTEFEHGIPICNEALKLIRDASLQEHVELAKQGLAERFRHKTFVSCFSARNDLRSQWDAYADEQRGFVISFDSLVVASLAAPEGYMLMPVEYGREAQVARARRAVVRALHDLEAALPGLPPRETIWTIQSRFVLLASEMFFFCASFKAPKYRSEHEWRLIYSRQPGEAAALPIHTRFSAEREIDYVIVDLKRRYVHDELPSFAAIRIGPRTGANAADLVRKYVSNHAKETKIEVQNPF
jgi:Protein of unknown function (DUF2971)